jgi:hypothetical protein
LLERRNGLARRLVVRLSKEAAMDREKSRQGSDGKPAEGERGKRASFDPKTGEVHGSGSGAGGGGNRAEDYDSDPMAGAGAEPAGGPRRIDDGAKRPIDKDEGV